MAYLLSHTDGIINCEDEAYIGAALGMALGVMRSTFFYKNDKEGKLQESIAAIKWRSVSPVFKGGFIKVSDEKLCDYYDYGDEIWFPPAKNKRVKQIAPAVISRNCELPMVTGDGEKPFVVASLNPNGVYSIAAVRRCCNNAQSVLPSVFARLDCMPEHIGVFGLYKSITFDLETVPKKVKLISIYSGRKSSFNGALGKTLTITENDLQSVYDMTDKSENAVEIQIEY